MSDTQVIIDTLRHQLAQSQDREARLREIATELLSRMSDLVTVLGNRPSYDAAGFLSATVARYQPALAPDARTTAELEQAAHDQGFAMSYPGGPGKIDVDARTTAGEAGKVFRAPLRWEDIGHDRHLLKAGQFRVGYVEGHGEHDWTWVCADRCEHEVSTLDEAIKRAEAAVLALAGAGE